MCNNRKQAWVYDSGEPAKDETEGVMGGQVSAAALPKKRKGRLMPPLPLLSASSGYSGSFQ